MAQIDRIGRLTRPLTITCMTCGHRVVWTPQQARDRLGWDCHPREARRRLKCRACDGEGRPAGFVSLSAR